MSGGRTEGERESQAASALQVSAELDVGLDLTEPRDHELGRNQWSDA